MKLLEEEQKFIDKAKLEVKEMLEDDKGSEYCEDIYKKYRAIFLMLDMIRLVEQKNNPATEGLIQKMKEAMETKLEGSNKKQ